MAFYDVPLGEHSTEHSFSPLLVYDRGAFPYAIPEGAACSCFGGCPLSLFFSSVRTRYLRGALGLSDLFDLARLVNDHHFYFEQFAYLIGRVLILQLCISRNSCKVSSTIVVNKKSNIQI